MNFADKVRESLMNNTTSLFYVGQAGFIIKSAIGTLIAVDLYLSDCLEQIEGHIGFKRLLPKIMSERDIRLDYIIATHPHADHFDEGSIPEMMQDSGTVLFASVDCKQFEEKYEIDNKRITYVKPGDSYNAADIKVRFVNCDHGLGAPDAVGVIIEVDNKRIYMAGDTCLRLDRVDEYTQFGDIDILIGPINGAYGNMNEEEFAQFSERIKPELTIPCHYGMFASHGGNPGKFMEYMKQNGNKYYLMTMGEELILQ